MIFWILLAVLAVVAIIVGICQDYADEGFFAALVTAAIGGGVLFFGGTLITAFGGEVKSEVREYGLAALATRTDQPGGYFFLGSGVVEGKHVYRYVWVDKNGGHRMATVGIGSAVIYEEDSEPRLLVEDYWRESAWLPWGLTTGSVYHFFVPEGSIIRGFEVAP